jgi:primosomal protein N' (replication factor Y)
LLKSQPPRKLKLPRPPKPKKKNRPNRKRRPLVERYRRIPESGMKYAEVSVNSPAARRRTFSYAVPAGMDIREGQAVLVPFGEKVLQGVVIELSPVPVVEDTREIIGIITPNPVLSPYHLALAGWISDYYLSPLFDAVALMLPPGFERKAVTFVSAARPDIDLASLNDDQKKVLNMIMEQGRVALKRLEKALGKKKASSLVSSMVRQNLVARSYELGPVRIKPKKELYLTLTGDISKAVELPPKQADLFRLLIDKKVPIAWAEARRQTGCGKSVADALVRRGLAVFQEVDVRREPISYSNIQPSSPLVLTTAQQVALDSVKSALHNSSSGVFLLHGVTGSGKTEVYLQALAEAVKLGKKGIVLVPEIALTPQTIERFAARFPRRVAVLHSRLSLGEQFDEWHRIYGGEFDVVIGSRSAIFAPQPDLGLIIIDEEHEWTYKQDNLPYYHARALAIKLAELMGAVVLLGSATPDVESFYKAQSGEYKLLTLPERVVPTAGSPLPQVEVVDMREELKAGNRSIFSRSLSYAINEAVTAEEQVILFLNRRGGATFIQCRSCGHVLCCRRCEVPLAQHIAADVLICHQCGYKTPVPQACPRCSRQQLKFLGAGTQKLEQETRYAFPRARQLRWDSDIISGKTSHEAILQNLPDFRAGERAFQLLSQVAGRAGRGPSGGRVIIQSYSPEHYAIKAAARHDYASFYEQEIAYRQQLHNPPFTQLARLVYVHTNDAVCQREAEKMKKRLLEESATRGVGGVDIIGPAPAFIRRLRGRFRWQLILRGSELSSFLSSIDFPHGWIVDIDPVGLVQ